MKVKVRTEIISEDQNIISEKLGILKSDNILNFKENDTNVIFNLKEQTMVRENKELSLKYIFLKNRETLNEVIIKDNNLILPLAILTLEFLIEEKSCYVKYLLVEEKSVVEYRISWEEVK